MYHQLFYESSGFDGQCCAAIYKTIKYNCKFNPVLRGEIFDDTDIDTDFDVVSLFNFCPDDPYIIQTLIEKVPVLYWFDHHESSRIMYKKEKFHRIHTPPGVFVSDLPRVPRGSCELFYMHKHECEYDAIPYYIRLLGRYEIGDYSDPNTIPFQYAMKSWLPDPSVDMQQWKKIIRPSSSDHTFFKKMIEHGKYIRMYAEKEARKQSAALSFEMDFEGLRTLAINSNVDNSLLFESNYDKEKHDLVLQFVYHNAYWKLSLRSDKGKVHCGMIAKRYGGDGYKHMAECLLLELPDSILKKIGGQ